MVLVPIQLAAGLFGFGASGNTVSVLENTMSLAQEATVAAADRKGSEIWEEFPDGSTHGSVASVNVGEEGRSSVDAVASDGVRRRTSVDSGDFDGEKGVKGVKGKGRQQRCSDGIDEAYKTHQLRSAAKPMRSRTVVDDDMIASWSVAWNDAVDEAKDWGTATTASRGSPNKQRASPVSEPLMPLEHSSKGFPPPLDLSTQTEAPPKRSVTAPSGLGHPRTLSGAPHSLALASPMLAHGPANQALQWRKRQLARAMGPSDETSPSNVAPSHPESIQSIHRPTSAMLTGGSPQIRPATAGIQSSRSIQAGWSVPASHSLTPRRPCSACPTSNLQPNLHQLSRYLPAQGSTATCGGPCSPSVWRMSQSSVQVLPNQVHLVPQEQPPPLSDRFATAGALFDLSLSATPARIFPSSVSMASLPFNQNDCCSPPLSAAEAPRHLRPASARRACTANECEDIAKISDMAASPAETPGRSLPSSARLRPVSHRLEGAADPRAAAAQREGVESVYCRAAVEL